MTQLVHQSPLGALEIPGVLGAQNPGDRFDVAPDIARSLLLQHGTFRAAPGAAAAYELLTIEELAAIASDRGITTKAKPKKADIIAAIAAADAQEATA